MIAIIQSIIFSLLIQQVFPQNQNLWIPRDQNNKSPPDSQKDLGSGLPPPINPPILPAPPPPAVVPTPPPPKSRWPDDEDMPRQPLVAGPPAANQLPSEGSGAWPPQQQPGGRGVSNSPNRPWERVITTIKPIKRPSPPPMRPLPPLPVDDSSNGNDGSGLVPPSAAPIEKPWSPWDNGNKNQGGNNNNNNNRQGGGKKQRSTRKPPITRPPPPPQPPIKQVTVKPLLIDDDDSKQRVIDGSGDQPPPINIPTIALPRPTIKPTTTRPPPPPPPPIFPTPPSSGIRLPIITDNEPDGSGALPPAAASPAPDEETGVFNPENNWLPVATGRPPVKQNQTLLPIPITKSTTTTAPGKMTTTMDESSLNNGGQWKPSEELIVDIELTSLFYPEYAAAAASVDASPPSSSVVTTTPGGALNNKLLALQDELKRNILNNLQTLPSERRVDFMDVRPPARSTISTSSGGVVITIRISTRNKDPVTLLYIPLMENAGRMRLLTNHTFGAVTERRQVCGSTQVYCQSTQLCVVGKYCDGVAHCPIPGASAIADDEPASCLKCSDPKVPNALELKIVSSTIQINQALTLTCTQIPDSCLKTIRWYHNNTRVNYADGNKQLTISSLKFHHFGDYECWAGDKMASINVALIPIAEPKLTLVPEQSVYKLNRLENGNRRLNEVVATISCQSSVGVVRWIPPNAQWPTMAISQRKSDQEVQLVFTLAAQEASGNYTCEVSYGDGSSRKLIKTIQVVGPCENYQWQCPNGGSCYAKTARCDAKADCEDLSDEISCPRCLKGGLTVSKSLVELDEGTSELVTCLGPTDCYPVFWRRKDRREMNNKRVNVAGSSLFVTLSSPEDSGEYECLSGNQSVNFKLVIHAKPTVKIVPSQSVHNLTFNSNLLIVCNSSSGFPQWRFVNNNNNNNKNQLWPDGVSTRNRELMFQYARPSMSGKYTCEVTWGKRVSSVSANVTINVEPIKCDLKSEFACKNGIRCVVKSHWCDGTAQCDDGSDEVNCPKCHYGKLEVRPQEQRIAVGKSIQLMCIAPPQCLPVTWQRADGRSLGDKIIVADNTLTIKSALPSHTAVYNCVSGSKSSSGNITVEENIQIKLINSPDFLMFPYGTEQRVVCEASGSTRELVWVREDGKPLNIGGSITTQVLGRGGLAMIHFEKPTFEASGVYKCIVPSMPQNGVRLMVYIKSVPCDTSTHKLCNDGKKCVPQSFVCNGRRDCLDGSDEEKCSTCQGQMYVTPVAHTTVSDSLVVFRCQVPSSNCLPVVWQRQDGRPMPPDRWIAPGPTLVIISTQRDDSGTIICRHGNIMATARLDVMDIYLQLNVTGDTLRIPRGGSGAVSCHSNMGQPVWVSPENKRVWQHGVRYDYPARGRMDIRFTNIQPQAAGVYQCVLRTTQGKSQKVILNLVVT